MTTNIHALSGIRTNDLSAHVIKAYSSDRAATGTGPPLSLVLSVAVNFGP
jgi:hypothetical protein